MTSGNRRVACGGDVGSPGDMFGIIQPAHVQMRAALPARFAGDFDAVLIVAEQAMPSWYDKGIRERGIAIIMGGWIEDRIAAGEFSLPALVRRKIAHLVGLAERYKGNDRGGDGQAANFAAWDTRMTLRDAEQEAERMLVANIDMDDLARRKRELAEKLDRLGKG